MDKIYDLKKLSEKVLAITSLREKVLLNRYRKPLGLRCMDLDITKNHVIRKALGDSVYVVSIFYNKELEQLWSRTLTVYSIDKDTLGIFDSSLKNPSRLQGDIKELHFLGNDSYALVEIQSVLFKVGIVPTYLRGKPNKDKLHPAKGLVVTDVNLFDCRYIKKVPQTRKVNFNYYDDDECEYRYLTSTSFPGRYIEEGRD